MPTTKMIRFLVLAAVAAGMLVISAGTATAGPVVSAGSRAGAACATLTVSATPKVNAQNAPFETIKNKVTSCASRLETVVLRQSLSGPFGPNGLAAKSWKLTLSPGQTVDKVQHIPYSCCGTYLVTDRVLSSSGLVLAKAHTSFTFA